MTEHTKCPSCGGSGEAGTCDECGGSGWVLRVESDVARLACRNATQECTLEELRIQVERLTAENARLREACELALHEIELGGCDYTRDAIRREFVAQRLRDALAEEST